jgi:ribokinase
MSVVVFGSINMDLVVRSPRFPAAGETLMGSAFFTAPGGKGANQAVAAACSGADTLMVGRVGDDVFGGELVANLRSKGVGTYPIYTDPTRSSGIAMITLNAEGENNIIIVSGANFGFEEQDFERLEMALRSARILLLQLEIPLEVVLRAAKSAQERGVKVILDPAPAQPLPDELFRYVTMITPNRVEAETLLGFKLETQADVQRGVQAFLDKGVQEVIIKMGREGAYWSNGTDSVFIPAFSVRTIDTVAAGDAFNGCLAGALDEGKPMIEALRWAAAGAALSTTKPGAQDAMASKSEIQALIDRK